MTLDADDSLPVEAFTILPLELEDPQYQWFVGEPLLLNLDRDAEDSANALVTPVGWNGKTALTVTDLGSAALAEELGLDPATFTKTVTVIIGTGVAPDVSPFSLRSATRSADGRFHMKVSGKAGRAFTLQTSTDRVDWVDVREVVAQENDVELSELDLDTAPNRFYRLLPADL